MLDERPGGAGPLLAALIHGAQGGRHVWEWFIALLALAVISALLLQSRDTSPGVQLAARVINWIVWLAFCTLSVAELDGFDRVTSFRCGQTSGSSRSRHRSWSRNLGNGCG
ncbi:MAG: hypothetical protein H0U94_14160 [Acidobacteria bacterium]|nr:hypothetical protein [Acidobacteriota bacterium]